MEEAFWKYVVQRVPEISSCRDLRMKLTSKARRDIELRGHVDIRLMTRLNIALHEFMQDCAETYHLTGQVHRLLEIVLPKVRLGDVTTEDERRIMAEVLEKPEYEDPDIFVVAPEWNDDFVKASDIREDEYIEPRYMADDEATIDAVTRFIAGFCRRGNGIVVHTGAGVSQSAGLATYREGKDESVSIAAAMPTYAHFAIVALNRLGFVDYIASQNVDGLHRRSGLPASSLSELHGNAYIETCSCCSPPLEFVRPYDAYDHPPPRPRYEVDYHANDGSFFIKDCVKVKARGKRSTRKHVPLTENEKSSGIPHVTGRACPSRGGPLRDSVIHFSENLPQDALEEAYMRSANTSLNLVIGCSLLVKPAADLPFNDITKGPVAIVALSCTGGDKKALQRGGVLLHAPSDVVVERIVKHLGVNFPNSPDLMSCLRSRVSSRDQAIFASDASVPYDGGADGGVVPDAMLRWSSAEETAGSEEGCYAALAGEAARL